MSTTDDDRITLSTTRKGADALCRVVADELARYGCVERADVHDGAVHVEVRPMHDDGATENERNADLDESSEIIRTAAAKFGFEDSLESFGWNVILRPVESA